MKIEKQEIVGVIALIVIAITIPTVVHFSHKDRENASVEPETEIAVAGVTEALSTANTTPSVSTAGVSEMFQDFNTTDVALNDKYVVGSGYADDGSFCGYYNLGMCKVESGNLNVRSGPSTDNKIVGKMTHYNACEVLGTDGDWTQIKSGKVEGYVKSEYLITGEEAFAIAEEEVQTIARIDTTTLRVRSEPTTESSTISLVGEGEKFVIIDISDAWAKIEVDDEEGWVCLDYVTMSLHLNTAKTITELRYGQGVSDVRVSLVNFALQYVGNRYVWGGTSLTKGVDCSGFTMKVYEQYGISLPHSSKAQANCGTRVKASEAKPGDLFFYGKGKGINHVAIYIGGGQIVHASNKRDGIKISNAFYRTPICVVRLISD